MSDAVQQGYGGASSAVAVVNAPQHPAPVGRLPFTGFDVTAMVAAALVCAIVGVLMRRLAGERA